MNAFQTLKAAALYQKLCTAAQENDATTIDRLGPNADVNYTPTGFDSLLQVATEYGNLEAVRALVHHGANLSGCNPSGPWPTAHGGTALVELLERAGLDCSGLHWPDTPDHTRPRYTGWRDDNNLYMPPGKTYATAGGTLEDHFDEENLFADYLETVREATRIEQERTGQPIVDVVETPEFVDVFWIFAPIPEGGARAPAVADLVDRLCWDEEHGMSMDHENLACDALRYLLIYTMKHNLPALRALLSTDFEFLNTNDYFFPESYEEWRTRRPRSLLGIALLDAESPRAVKMILAHGADPNAELWSTGFCDYGPPWGLGSYATYLAHNSSPERPTRLACLRVLLDGGADAVDGAIAFGNLRGDWKEEVDLCHSYFDVQDEAMRVEIRRLWRMPWLLGSIAGYWAHAAVAPDSKAVRKAWKRFEDASARSSVDA